MCKQERDPRHRSRHAHERNARRGNLHVFQVKTSLDEAAERSMLTSDEGLLAAISWAEGQGLGLNVFLDIVSCTHMYRQTNFYERLRAVHSFLALQVLLLLVRFFCCWTL